MTTILTLLILILSSSSRLLKLKQDQFWKSLIFLVKYPLLCLLFQRYVEQILVKCLWHQNNLNYVVNLVHEVINWYSNVTTLFCYVCMSKGREIAICCCILTRFFPVFPLDPSENIRKRFVFWCFHGDQKETVGRNRLRKVLGIKKYHLQEWSHDLFIFRCFRAET